MNNPSFTIPLVIREQIGVVDMHVYKTVEQLREAIKELNEVPKGTIAYTHTYSVQENCDVFAEMYLTRDPGIETIAHECTHLALGILSRAGHKNLSVTTKIAPALEEELATLVGGLTHLVYHDMQSYQYWTKPNKKGRNEKNTNTI